MGIWIGLKKLFNVMRQRLDLTCCIFTLLFTVIRFWTGANGALKIISAQPPEPIFNSEYVIDLHLTNLNDVNALLRSSEVSFVFSYAHWCHRSLQAAKYFAEIAQEMHSKVLFIAINCWSNNQVCKNIYDSSTFPQTYLHHQILRKPIQYRGPHQKRYYKEFLNKALNPVVYLGTSNDVDAFLRKSQVTVVGTFNRPSLKYTLRKYTGVALSALEQYPVMSVPFGLVLNKDLSKELQLKDNVLKLYDQTTSKVHAVRQFRLANNVTVADIIHWMSLQLLALRRFSFTNEKSNVLYKVLKEGPALITFTKDLGQVEVVKYVATRYKSLEQSACCCCKSFEHPLKHRVCMKDGNSMDSMHDCTFAHKMIHNFQNLFSDLLPRLSFNQSCFELKANFDGSRLEICPIHTSSGCLIEEQNNKHYSIDNLNFRTNRTLNFISLDIELHQGIAEDLGFNIKKGKTFHTAIADISDENFYTMDTGFSKETLESFILNYTNRRLLPTRSLKPQESVPQQTDSGLHIPSLLEGDFAQVVLNSSKDVLVYYHASWCGACSTCSHVLVTLKAMLGDLKHFEIYQVDERTNKQLPLPFKALCFPSLILYSDRVGDSVRYSPTVPCSLPNFVGFLLRHASPVTKAQLLLSVCGRQPNDLLFPSDICRMDEIMHRLLQNKMGEIGNIEVK